MYFTLFYILFIITACFSLFPLKNIDNLKQSSTYNTNCPEFSVDGVNLLKYANGPPQPEIFTSGNCNQYSGISCCGNSDVSFVTYVLFFFKISTILSNQIVIFL